MARPLSGENAFRALAHSTRREILLVLRRQERSAGDILPMRSLSKPALSDHLRALQHAGLIQFRRKGTRLIYRLNARAMRPVEEFLAQMRHVLRS